MNRIASPVMLVPEVVVPDQRRLERMRRVGYLLDNSIPIPGARFRLGIDQLIGLVPGIGDLFDIGFKANIRNLVLLDGYLRRPDEVRRSSRRFEPLITLGLLLLTAGGIAFAVVLVRLLVGLLR